MSNDILLNTANKYLLDDLENASISGERLAIIIEKLESKEEVSNDLLEYLNRKGFLALHLLATGEITFADYLPLAQEDQNDRRAATEKKAQRLKFLAEAEEAEQERQRWTQRMRERNEAEQRARQAKIRDRELRWEYGLKAFIKQTNYPTLMRLVRNLDKGLRISAEEFIWLSTQDDENYECYLTTELAIRYHSIEAKHLVAEFKRTGDPWHAVNASGHFRKCEQPGQAEQLLECIEISRVKGAKLQSALCTTHGGAKRDLRKFDMALELGSRAHELTPRDFRPCTLLGAVYYEQGNYEQGEKWYDEAVKRGFKESQVDNELKSIFSRLDRDMQIKMRNHLLSLDQERYEWADK
jgi:hypothetical protein